MKCQNCGYENRPGVRFCEECGEQLMEAVPTTACPACGHSNRPGAQFCEECGESLVEAAPTMACPACGHLNRVGARFCEECGQPLVLPRPRRLTIRRVLLGGLVLVLLILAGRFVYFGSWLLYRSASPPPTTQISEQEILATAEERVREFAPWLADVEPTVQTVQFSGDQGYVVTYQRDVEVSVEGETTTLTQRLVVSINAVTGEISVAESH